MASQYFKLDNDGNIIGTDIFDDYGSIPIDYKLGWNEKLYNPKYSYELRKWIDDLTDSQLLDMKKQEKMANLRSDCSKHIVGRFLSNVDGVDYYFSCDHEAQINFGNSFRAFQEGWITSTKWTCYDVNGNVVRVDLDINKFNPIYIAHLAHIQSSVARLRDYLQPLVMQAQSLEDLGNIQW